MISKSATVFEFVLSIETMRERGESLSREDSDNDSRRIPLASVPCRVVFSQTGGTYGYGDLVQSFYHGEDVLGRPGWVSADRYGGFFSGSWLAAVAVRALALKSLCAPIPVAISEMPNGAILVDLGLL